MILEATAASKSFRGRRGTEPVHAVKAVDLRARPGEFVTIVGESGSGKSTLARLLLGLTPLTSGDVRLDGRSLTAMSGRERAHYRRSVQAVLQDPAGSLNPRKTVGTAIGEVVRLHRIATGRDAVRRTVLDTLSLVGLDPPEALLDRHPDALSGGQRQRVLIARAIVLEPRIIIADEAVSALDASVKASVLLLMDDLRRSMGVGYVFITHDLPVVRKVADHVYVMKSGEIVEDGPLERVFSAPEHRYTAQLLASAPSLDAVS